MIAPRPDYDKLNKDITPSELAEILGPLNVTVCDGNVSCSCPHFDHEDQNPSCSIYRHDGVTLLKCHSQCDFVGNPVMAYAWVYDVPYPEAAQELTTQLADLRAGQLAPKAAKPIHFPGVIYTPSVPPSLTLDEYAAAKKLPRTLLQVFNIEDASPLGGGSALSFPCYKRDGAYVVDRRRLWMKAPDGEKCFDHPFSREVYPFGLQRLKGGLPEGQARLILVEGESDTLTLAHHDMLAVGIPGASSFKAEWPDLFPDFEIMVWREHGMSGDTFVKKVGQYLPDAVVVHDKVYDDPSALHLAVDGDRAKFQERFAKLIDAARPISDVMQEIEAQKAIAKQGHWAEPILPDEDPEPDPYPTYDLPHSLYRFVEEVAESTQVATDMALLATLSTVSACVAGKAQVSYNWPEPVQLWTATIADTGTRKSPVFRLVQAPVETWLAEETERTKVERAMRRSRKASLEKKLEALERLASGQKIHIGSPEWKDILKEQADIRTELEDYPSVGVPRLIVSDATPEALVRVMADNHERVFVASSEADVLKILAGLYSNQPNLGLWKAAYDCDPFQYDRVRDSQSIQLNRPALAATLMLQPTVLQELRNKRTFTGEGLLGRFIFAVPKSNTGYRNTGLDVSPPDPGVLGEYNRRIKTLLDLPFPDKKQTLPVLTFTPGALTLLYDLEAEIEKEQRPTGSLYAIRDWGHKLFSKALRLAGVLHVFEAAQYPSMTLVGGGTIDEDIVQAAADLARASIPHAATAYRMLNMDEGSETLQYVFRRYLEILKSGDPVTKRDLFQAVKNKPALRTRVSSLDSYIDNLEGRDVLRQVKTTGIGRPSVVLIPNPALLAPSSGPSMTVTTGSAGSSDPFDPVSEGREEDTVPERGFDPFDPVSEVENVRTTSDSPENFKKIDDLIGPEEKLGSSEPLSEKNESAEGDQHASDTLDLQDQKDQNSSNLDDPDSLPPDVELY